MNFVCSMDYSLISLSREAGKTAHNAPTVSFGYVGCNVALVLRVQDTTNSINVVDNAALIVV